MPVGLAQADEQPLVGHVHHAVHNAVAVDIALENLSQRMHTIARHRVQRGRYRTVRIEEDGLERTTLVAVDCLAATVAIDVDHLQGALARKLVAKPISHWR